MEDPPHQTVLSSKLHVNFASTCAGMLHSKRVIFIVIILFYMSTFVLSSSFDDTENVSINFFFKYSEEVLDYFKIIKI